MDALPREGTGICYGCRTEFLRRDLRYHRYLGVRVRFCEHCWETVKVTTGTKKPSVYWAPKRYNWSENPRHLEALLVTPTTRILALNWVNDTSSENNFRKNAVLLQEGGYLCRFVGEQSFFVMDKSIFEKHYTEVTPESKAYMVRKESV